MLRLNLGDLLTWQGEEYVVAAARTQTVMLRRLSDNDIVWVDVPTMADELILADPAEGPDVGDVAPHAAQISDAELEKASWWVQHLNEVAHGVPDPDDPDVVPRPGYGAGTSKQDRQELKVRELSAAGHRVSIRSLQRKQRAFDAHGVHGLVDRRALRSGTAPKVDDRILEAVLAVLAATRSDSTVTVSTLMDKSRVVLARRYPDEAIELPSDRTMRRLFAAYDRRGLATGKATRRRTDSNRHGRGPRPVAATTPGQYVEIDSTPINVMALLSDGRAGRVHLTVAVDVATRSILAFDIVPVGASKVEHADLLARMLRPRACRPDALDYMRLDRSADLPAAAMLAADARQAGAIAVPYIVPETITTDRGKDYLSETFVSACRHLESASSRRRLTPPPTRDTSSASWGPSRPHGCRSCLGISGTASPTAGARSTTPACSPSANCATPSRSGGSASTNARRTASCATETRPHGATAPTRSTPPSSMPAPASPFQSMR